MAHYSTPGRAALVPQLPGYSNVPVMDIVEKYQVHPLWTAWVKAYTKTKIHPDSHTKYVQVTHCSVLFSLHEWKQRNSELWIGYVASVQEHMMQTLTKPSQYGWSTKHGNTTRSIMVVRILPCLGTSSCPAVAGKKLNWWSPPRLVLLLPCQTDSSTLTSHSPLPMGDRIIGNLSSSLSFHASHFLSTFLSFSTTFFHFLVWIPCKSKPCALGPKDQQLLLFTPSIHLSFDRSSKCLPLWVPLLSSKLYCTEQGQELLSHVTQLDSKKKKKKLKGE